MWIVSLGIGLLKFLAGIFSTGKAVETEVRNVRDQDVERAVRNADGGDATVLRGMGVHRGPAVSGRMQRPDTGAADQD